VKTWNDRRPLAIVEKVRDVRGWCLLSIGRFGITAQRIELHDGRVAYSLTIGWIARERDLSRMPA
jgi:hypothetical protein